MIYLVGRVDDHSVEKVLFRKLVFYLDQPTSGTAGHLPPKLQDSSVMWGCGEGVNICHDILDT